MRRQMLLMFLFSLAIMTKCGIGKGHAGKQQQRILDVQGKTEILRRETHKCRQGELYQDVWQILEEYNQNKGTVKALCLRDTIKRKAAALALASRTLAVCEVVDSTLTIAGVTGQPSWLLRVVAYDLLFRGALVGRRADNVTVETSMRLIRQSRTVLKNAFVVVLHRYGAHTQHFYNHPSVYHRSTRIKFVICLNQNSISKIFAFANMSSALARYENLAIDYAYSQVLLFSFYSCTYVHGATNASSLLETCLQAYQPQHPKYLRVNLIKATVESVLASLQTQGYRNANLSEVLGADGKHSKLVCMDDMLDDLLVLPPGTDLHANSLVTSGAAVLQDKASCLPVHVLADLSREKNLRVIVDACAAPGNKATHAQALVLEAGGIIVAVERDTRRAQLLKQTTQRLGADRVVVVQGDWLQLDMHEEPQASAQAIIVDPSCSASCVQASVDALRLSALAAFQIKALERALSYPKVKYVVYSTCSVERKENEDVVQTALAKFGQTFALVPCLPNWVHRGQDSFSGGSECLRADPWRDKTHAFFVACFVRKPVNTS